MTRLPVVSSAVKSVGFEDGILEVEFSSGVYRMEGISQEQFDDLLAAKSIGAAVNALKSQCTACVKVEEDEA